MDGIQETQNRINLSANSLQNAASKANGEDKLEKADFMNLFMYQLANQNPLDPMDSSKMMASLAELGSMEQLQSLNKEFKGIAASQKELIQLNALNYLNHNIHIKNDKIQVADGQVSRLNYQLDDKAHSIKANIVNQSGKVIRQINLGGQDKGSHELKWDGKNNLGRLAPFGEYRAEFHAYDAKGQSVAVNVTKEEKVSQIKLEGTKPLLKVGDKFIGLAEALMINQK